MKKIIRVVAILAIVSLAACVGGAAPSPVPGVAAGTPTPAVGSFGRVPLDPNGVPPGQHGAWQLWADSRQPVTSGEISVVATLTGGAQTFLLVDYEEYRSGNYRCFLNHPKATWSEKCSRYKPLIAEPVNAVNGKAVVVGFVAGLTFPGNVVLVYMSTGETKAEGYLDLTITAR